MPLVAAEASVMQALRLLPDLLAALALVGGGAALTAFRDIMRLVEGIDRALVVRSFMGR
jgi:hypothetical protein